MSSRAAPMDEDEIQRMTAGRGALGKLIAAAYLRDLPTAQAALDEGAPAHGTDGYGETALSLACRRGSAEVAALLLNRGANVDAAPNGGWTALMRAAVFGRPQCISTLLANGARLDLRNAYADRGRRVGAIDHKKTECHDPWGPYRPTQSFGEKDSQGFTGGDQALALACRGGRDGKHAQCVKLLLDAGADPNDANRHGVTPLMIAASRGFTEICEHLVLAGARLDVASLDGETVEDRAMNRAGTHKIWTALLSARTQREALILEASTSTAPDINDPTRNGLRI